MKSSHHVEFRGIPRKSEFTRFSRHRVSSAGKKKFEVKKVTYNMYSCYTWYMDREMMEIDNRDSAECQNWGKNGHNGHYLNFK